MTIQSVELQSNRQVASKPSSSSNNSVQKIDLVESGMLESKQKESKGKNTSTVSKKGSGKI